MRDRLLIYAGLGLFLLLAGYPVWHGLLTGASAAGPDTKAATGKGNCVAPRSFMRSSHMSLLMQWRDAKVRGGERIYRAYDGKEYPIDLTGTCLARCHGGSREKFCDRCHNFAGVPTPDCWGCHAAPLTGQLATAPSRTGGGP